MSITGTDSSSMTTTQSKYLTVEAVEGFNNLGQVVYNDEDASKRLYMAQILKSSVKVSIPGETGKFQEYYAFYPVPTIHYYNYSAAERPFDIRIKADETLRTVTYNADGRHPLYNKNQGISLEFIPNAEYSSGYPYVVFSAEGGLPVNKEDNPGNPNFILQKEKNESQEISEAERFLYLKLEPKETQSLQDIENENKALDILQEE